MTDTQKMFKASSIDYLQHDGPVTVIRPLEFAVRRRGLRADAGLMFRVRSVTGIEFDAFDDELNDIPEPTDADPEPEEIDSPEPIILSEDDITIERNDEYIDVRMHDDTRPEHWPTIFASLTLDDQSARRLATKLLDVSGPSVDDILQRVLNETPDGAAFDLNTALRLAAQIARGEV